MVEPIGIYTRWCKGIFESLNEGGMWGIPRTGLLFRKGNGTLTLVALMPHVPEMIISPEELLERQRDEFEVNRVHFERAGVTLIDGVGITKCAPQSKPTASSLQ